VIGGKKSVQREIRLVAMPKPKTENHAHTIPPIPQETDVSRFG